MPTASQPTRWPIGAVVVAAILFGTAGTAQELGPDASTPLGVAAARIGIGAFTLWAIVGLRCRCRPRIGPSRLSIGTSIRNNRWMVVLGGAGVALYSPFFLAATDRAGVAVATVVAIAAGPVFAGGLEWLTQGRRPLWGWALGTAVSIVGAFMLVGATAAPGKEVDAIGVGLAAMSGFGYAVYSITAKTSMERGMDSTVALAAPFGLGAVALVVAASTQPMDWVNTPAGIVMALYLGVISTGIAYVLFGYGLNGLTAATAVTLVLAEPVTAVLLASAVLDESITPIGWFGIAVVLIGLVVVGRTASPTT